MQEVNESVLAEVERIARKAGDLIMEVYARDFAVVDKDDKSPLTEADARAHSFIVSELKALSPVTPILSEEDVGSFTGQDKYYQYWLVDPLDGTKEFIKRNGEFTVNIALIDSGKAILGVVYAPAIDVLYSAAQGFGAKKVEGNETASISVSSYVQGELCRVVGSRSHGSDAMGTFLQRLPQHQMVAMGSSLKLCLIAEGKADIYPRLGPTSLWDTAAAQCVVEVAGGKVVTLAGEPLGYGNTSKILNPYFLATGAGDIDWVGMFSDIV
ncbi:adenosine-3'(2'),5'-bisphosphate nucleotidase [Pokkaliibacter plantistimulans]|uniref:3'(2'),5'-bisphosphate nucleotidase CysQ n=1 Tax=Pokkaliibacter plantistimulans TaxID=1635171 RepID=A0ABX5M2B6_9GAMM|nr:3'(2'),5'-bisphosphate nucleotidase CysQ [Pokkaliibacter plantistimulans]PXF31818.1 adenosine-3'(2'),5'-bisphosphate nucleotidase [Pokkaliibacter plantistimulans]